MTAIIQSVPDQMSRESPFPVPSLDRLARYCQRLLGNPQAAEEIAQEVVIAGWQQQHLLRDMAAYERWLFGIARNMCRRWIGFAIESKNLSG